MIVNYEKQTPKIPGLADAYRNAFNNPSEEQIIRDRVKMARKVDGYEAVFDPDKAISDLGRRAVREAEDALHPQHQPAYEELEGSRFDFLDGVSTGPDHTIQEGRTARAQAEASITTHGDGTHTLGWEMQRDVTVNSAGQVIQDHTKSR